MSMVGCKPFYNAAATGSVVGLTKNPASLVWFNVQNTNGSTVYLQLFNKRMADVTLGTTEPTLTFAVGANGDRIEVFPFPTQFDTALSYAVTTTKDGNTSPGSTCVVQGGRI